MTHRFIEGQTRDLGGFSVARILPAAVARNVGPFVFFDHMGPVDFPPGQGMAVRPHPHIGLATVTYLFEGAMMHRDSIGSVAQIVPGDVNWMSAGRGVVHSERSPDAMLRDGHKVHGIQIWVAQAEHQQDDAPTFSHIDKRDLPSLSAQGAQLRLVLGEAFGLRAPIRHSIPLFYVHAVLEPGARLPLAADYPERALYAVDHAMLIDGTPLKAGSMAVLDPNSRVTIEAPLGGTVMLLGGAALDQPRFLNWNFVATTQARIDQARDSWRSYPNQQFPAVPGETEWIPLPAR
jgi:redox-sensitive bicupin YhaK (pirin superfamily)